MPLIEFGGKTIKKAEERLQSKEFIKDGSWKYFGVYPKKVKWGKERGYVIWWTNNKSKAKDYTAGTAAFFGHKKDVRI